MTGETTSAGSKFDPNNFTKDELLRLVYRDIQSLIIKMDNQLSSNASDKRETDNKIKAAELDIRELKTIITQQDKSFKTSLTVVSIFLGILSIVSGLIGWILTQ